MIKKLSFVLAKFCRSQFSPLYLAVIVLTFFVSTPTYSQVYAYATAYESGDSVAGYSSVTGYHNSSTHIYTTNATLSSPTRSVSSSTSGTSASLSISIQLEHGFYSLASNFVGTCPNPQGGGNHAVGGSGSSVTVAPFCTLGDPAFVGSNTTITPTSLKVSVYCTDVTTVTVQGVIKSPRGAWTLLPISSIPHNVPAGGSVEFSPFTFERNGDPPTSCAPACDFIAGVSITSPTGSAIKGVSEKYMEMMNIIVNP